MKKINFLKLSFVAAALVALPFFNSCSSDEVNNQEVLTESNQDFEFGAFTKDLTVYNADKSSSVVVKVGSNDKAVLDLWKTENFKLDLLSKDETLSSLNLEQSIVEDRTSEDDSDEVAAKISYMIVKNNTPKGYRVVLTTTSPYSDDLRGWRYENHYSAKTNNGHFKATIKGQNFWKRGYYGVYYKKNSSSTWLTIQSTWTKIKRRQVRTYEKNPCYQMLVKRKYKGRNSNSVVVTIEEF